MKLRSLLNEIDRKATTALISKYFHECLSKYFSQYKKYDWEIPTFKLRAGTRNAGEFQSVTTKTKPMNPTLIINPDFAQGEFLRPIVFHETIHYIQANLYHARLDPYFSQHSLKSDWHDAYFHKMMNEMNSKEGAGYITQKQDATKLGVAHKEFFVYGFVTMTNQYAYIWSSTESESIKKWLETVENQKYKSVFEFKTADYYFKTANTQVKGTKMRFGVIDNPEKIELVKKYIK